MWDYARGGVCGDGWLQWSQCGSGYVGGFLDLYLGSLGLESLLRHCPNIVFFFFLGWRHLNLKEHGEIKYLGHI